MNYKNFDKYILRVPLLSQSTTHNITSSKLRETFKQKHVQEALFLASPELFETTQKYLEGKLVNHTDIKKLEFTLLKYLSRMSHRCTPFGLFAGCSVGTWDNSTDISLKDINEFSRHTRLDMNYLCSLSLELNKNHNLRKELSYRPNSSIYKVGNKYRYIEYRYESNIRRHYIVAIDKFNYLTKILERARNSASIRELILTIIDDDISYEDAQYFVNELIDNQVLVSNIEPNVIGEEYLSILINNSSSIPEINKKLKSIDELLQSIDANIIGESFRYYKQIISDLSSFGVKINKQFLFQTDLVVETKVNKLNKVLISQIWDGIEALNCLSGSTKNSNLRKFIRSFSERYEDQEVALTSALDIDVGIGYLQDGIVGKGNECDLLDDLVFNEQGTMDLPLKLDSYQKFLYEKLLDSIAKNKKEITIEDKDIIKFKKNNLSKTFSAVVEVFTKPDENIVRIIDVGGSTASNMIGRFSHADADIHDYVYEISKKEKELFSDVVVAEISHLPESRVGNILLRPIVRDYEIPYLANSTLDNELQISIDDLMVSVINDKIVLRSKKLNKVIVPRLSTAHNYSMNSQPIYHFLCDLQMQGRDEFSMIDWGEISKIHNYLPRVRYKNIILSPASWFLNTSLIKELLHVCNKNDIDIAKCESWRKKFKIPREILLIESDNELYLDLDNELYVGLFLDLLAKKKKVLIQEYLFLSHNQHVNRDEEYFTNQVICSFYKN